MNALSLLPSFPRLPALRSIVEPLEARIAPASLSGNVLQYTDVDGDLVTIAFTTKARVSEGNFTFDTPFGSNGPQKLDTIDLSERRFEGTSIAMAVEQVQGGDGRADIRLIDASRVDLRNVTLLGDLIEMRAGDADATPAVRRLEVYSLGSQAAPAGAEAVAPKIDLVGGLKQLQVTTDIMRVEVSVAGERARIGSVSVGGSLIGGEAVFAGSISASGNIGHVIIGGDIRGGSGELSGAIRVDGSIGRVSLGGSLVGGEAQNAGVIEALGNIASVIIGGDIRGGRGDSSGQIDVFGKLKTLAITGSVLGGEGRSSGNVTAGEIRVVTITGDLAGGDGQDSGLIRSRGDVGLFQVNGSITGSTGAGSGLLAGGKVHSVVVLGDVLGGEGAGSGSIDVGNKIRAATITGSITGGSGERSGALVVARGIGSIAVLGSLAGGEGDFSGSIEAGGAAESILVGGSVRGSAGAASGKITAGNLGALLVARDLVGGEGERSGVVDVRFLGVVVNIGGSVIGSSGVASGTIFGGKVVKVSVAGDLRGGSADFSGVIGAIFGLDSVTISGDMLGGAGLHSGSIGSRETQEVTIGGSLISGDGNFSGGISTGTYLSSLTINGDVVGNSSNPVRIIAEGFSGRFSGENIGTVQIGGSATYLDILAGYRFDGQADQPELNPVNDQVRIGRVVVQGNWTAGNIVAGVKDVDGNGFGNRDDVSKKPSPFISTIASIQIGGSVSGTPAAGDDFGFSAEWIKHVQIGGNNVPLNPRPGNDQLLAIPGAITGDITINEVK